MKENIELNNKDKDLSSLLQTAPELLEASINISEMLYFNKGEEIPEEAWDAAVNNLRSIIKKALGKEDNHE